MKKKLFFFKLITAFYDSILVLKKIVIKIHWKKNTFSFPFKIHYLYFFILVTTKFTNLKYNCFNIIMFIVL